MQLAIGPYDGRKARRKRCNACVKRKIKVSDFLYDSQFLANGKQCHGGTPCEYCRRAKQRCEFPTKPGTFTPVFVSQTARSLIQDEKNSPMKIETPYLPLMQSPTSDPYDRIIVYFFVTFLSTNNLPTSRFPMADDLLHLIQNAPALRNAISAVAVQHGIHRRPTLAATNKHHALQSYSHSITHINALIASNTFAQDPSALWTTFILGLFEVRSVTRSSSAYTNQ